MGKGNADAEAARIRRREERLAVASHDLRSPLSGVLLLLEGYRRKALDGTLANESVAEGMARAQDTIKGVLALADGLLDHDGACELHLERLDLREVVRDVIERHRPQLADAACAVSLHADAPVVGQWDRVRLEQIASNLLSNAIKFGAGKPIVVTIARRRDIARLSVRDRGRGIPERELPTIFERSGRRLGLWIVARIVEAFGGRVRVTSRSGAGATFTVSLPIKD